MALRLTDISLCCRGNMARGGCVGGLCAGHRASWPDLLLSLALGHQLVPNGSDSLLKLGPQTVSLLALSLSPTSLGRGPYARDVVRRQKPLPPYVTKNSVLTIFRLAQGFCHSLLAIHAIEFRALRTNENEANLFAGVVEFRV